MLRQFRNLFGAVLAICVAALALSVIKSWAYEPALAILLAVCGIFVVFWMKTREADSAHIQPRDHKADH